MITIILNTLIILVVTGGMGFLYRMHGGMKPKLPWKFDEILIGAVITLPILLLLFGKAHKQRFDPHYKFDWKLIGVTLAGTILKIKGHGQYMTLKFFPPWPRRIMPETWDVILTPLFGSDPRTSNDWTKLHHATKAKRIREYGTSKLYLRCLSGLFISGASVSVGLVGVLLYLHYWVPALVVLVLFGFSKPLGYALGWKFDPKLRKELDSPTEWGEVISGLGAGLATSYLLVYVVNVSNYVLTSLGV